MVILCETYSRNVLFIEALNIFYLQLYDHLYSKTGNPLLPLHVLLLSIFYKHHLTYRIGHITPFGIPVVERWLESTRRTSHYDRTMYYGTTSRS